MIDFINEFSKRIINSGLASRWTMRGCWGFEIRDLENHFGIKLPFLYKNFLDKMGKGAGKFMQGTDAFYKHLFDNRAAMEELLKSDGHPFPLSQTAFVFSSHQGYIFHFFDTAEDKIDPPVYGYGEGDLSTKLIAESFSAFLSGALDDEILAWSRVKE